MCGREDFCEASPWQARDRADEERLQRERQELEISTEVSSDVTCSRNFPQICRIG